MNEQITIQELYENINSLYTKEQINQLINLLSDNNSGDYINNTRIKIRLLSYDEYDKYIINGTFNGSITKDNVNVWHYIDKLNSTYVHNHTWSETNATYNYNDYYLSVLSDNVTNMCICNNRRQTILFNHTLYNYNNWSKQQTIDNSTNVIKHLQLIQ